MEKLKMHTPNITDANIEKLAELFPHCITEVKDEAGNPKRAIDFDLLQQELSHNIVDSNQERFQLNWVGKKEALLTANMPIARTLRPCKEESVNFDTTQNLYIEGDNLEALKLLHESYLAKLKMIYIDPPYNTGNDFIYEDDFAESAEAYKARSNQVDENKNRLIANTESNGRFHSDWLSMMFSRLKLARDLLRDDGVIFISIDDNEQANLKKLCDEVFGGSNYISLISVENNPKGRKNSKFISVSNDYCLIYAKNKEQSCFVENIPKSIDDMKEDDDGNFIHKSGKRVLVGENGFNKEVRDLSSEKHYSVYYQSKDKKIVFKNEQNINDIDDDLIQQGYSRYISFREGVFVENTYTKSKFMALFEDEALEFKSDKIFEKNFNSQIRMKSLLTNRKYSALVNDKVADYKIDVKTTSAGTNLKELFSSSDVIFPSPKNTGLIKLLLTLFEESDFIVMDFFSGSGTTADAVIQLNAESGRKIKFIMVQIPEICDEKSEAKALGFQTIAEIGKERIRKAGKKIKSENPDVEDLDIGFRVLKIDTTNMADIYYSPDAVSQDLLSDQVENIKPDRTSEDLLFQVLLDWGVDLTLPISRETIADKEVFFVAEDALAACFDNDITEDCLKEIAHKKPLRVVFRDSGFSSDSVKINVEQIFKLISPSTEIKTI